MRRFTEVQRRVLGEIASCRAISLVSLMVALDLDEPALSDALEALHSEHLVTVNLDTRHPAFSVTRLGREVAG